MGQYEIQEVVSWPGLMSSAYVERWFARLSTRLGRMRDAVLMRVPILMRVPV